ncbi:MAG: DUF4294 domain-containing protein [Flavobacteriales bacterium]|nr:DUF4294 domain-containing protein [Flavobacteriales bacterium]
MLILLPALALAQDDAPQGNLIERKKVKAILNAPPDSVARPVSTGYVLIQGKLYEALIIGADTIPLVSLPPVNAVAKRTFPNKRAEKKYDRLVYHVKKVLPYAKLAGKRMKEVEDELKTLGPKDRKRRLKDLEKEIKRDYEGELKKLSFTQGRILIKLLDRETGQVSYDIIKEFRGGFTAWFFQGIAKMFSYDLKQEYDPEKDDRLIESIVQKVEAGEL